jgi:hypothetical protein
MIILGLSAPQARLAPIKAPSKSAGLKEQRYLLINFLEFILTDSFYKFLSILSMIKIIIKIR